MLNVIFTLIELLRYRNSHQYKLLLLDSQLPNYQKETDHTVGINHKKSKKSITRIKSLFPALEYFL